MVFVAQCGAVPTPAPSEEELSKAQVNMSHLFFVGVI